MRLIDADALSKKLLEELHNRSMQGFGKGLMIANSCVVNAPTIEPKKGKWKEEIDTGERMLACSACGGRVFLETYETAVVEHGYRFCPYCGAQMEN